MDKIKTGWKLSPMPLPIALLGATVDGKPNFFTIAWFNMLQDDPPLIGAAMDKERYTKEGIKKHKTFSINIPPSKMVKVVDYCGLYSGSKIDKAGLFDVFYGRLETAPMVKECALNIECRFIGSQEFQTTELIIGEIVEVYCEAKYLSQNEPDYKKMDPLLFFMPHGPYFRAGDFLAKAYEVGENYEPKQHDDPSQR